MTLVTHRMGAFLLDGANPTHLMITEAMCMIDIVILVTIVWAKIVMGVGPMRGKKSNNIKCI